MVEASVTTEIERAVTHALSRKGVGGTVVVRENVAELHSDGPVVAIDLGDWVDQWNLLPPDMQDRRAEAAAMRLTKALRDLRGDKDRQSAKFGERIRKSIAVIVALGLFGGVGWWFHQAGFFGGSAATETGVVNPAPRASPETPDEAQARVRRSCEAARKRFFAGAALDLDTEGWVAELWLSRRGEQAKLVAEPALVAAVKTDAAKEIGVKGTAEAKLIKAGHDGLGAANVTMRFSGDYVSSFFNTKGRGRFIVFADKLADAVKADFVALYARCAHLKSHDVGAWYRGGNDAEATAALLYGAGAFSAPAAVDLRKLAGDGGVMGSLADAGAKLQAKPRDEIFRLAGVRTTRRDAKDGAAASTALRFPLGGPTKASRVSREIAKLLDL